MKLNGLTRTTAHSLLLKSMEPHRKKMYHDLIEESAKRKDEGSQWTLKPPKRPSQKDIEAAKFKGNVEEQYRLVDR